MNKKFLSAILFGALMVSSTGTFVSCKDYDDDIDELTSRVDGIESQIKDLEASPALTRPQRRFFFASRSPHLKKHNKLYLVENK